MKEMLVLYDPTCGLCCRVKDWLLGQRKYVDLIFVPANSEEAWYRFPKLNHPRTLSELTVITERGAVYRDAKAWLMCLWALGDYRAWALRLASPELLPTAKQVIGMISENRHKLAGVSKVRLKTDEKRAKT
jgi:predicted DCC family thiol-disulfide oxidoreductase YuxK